MKLRIADRDGAGQGGGGSTHRYDNCAIKTADGLFPEPDSESVAAALEESRSHFNMGNYERVREGEREGEGAEQRNT